MATMTITRPKKTIKSKNRKRRKPAKPIGARALLLTLALGGALGGWATLAISAMHEENSAFVSTAQPDPATEALVIMDPAIPGAPALQLPPVPTVQPPPDALAGSATATLAPIPAAPQPVIRRPIARTRSSR